jgi:geranylgeranyl diphosphate synthase type I
VESLARDDQLKDAIEGSLSVFLDRRSAEVPDAAVLIDEIRAMIAAGGKRLRPAFCYWGYRAAGAEHGNEIVAAAASLELLHAFALIHDDVMDSADTRRGRRSVNASHGTSFAILAGDLALVLADDAFMSSGFSDARVARAFGAYSRMRREVIAGQLLDIAAERQMPTIADARRIALLKSGRYTVSEPLIIGAVLAGGSIDLREQLGVIGDRAGEAFQLRDDLLGTFGSARRTGKATDSDITQGKRHYLFAHAVSVLSGQERDRFVSMWGRDDLDADDIEWLRHTLVATGSRAATEDLIEGLHRDAHRALDAAPLDDVARGEIGALIDRAIARDE